MRSPARAKARFVAGAILLAHVAVCGCAPRPRDVEVRVARLASDSERRHAPVAPDVAMLSSEGAALRLRRSAVADQWFWLRAKVVEGEVPMGFERARAAMQDLRAALTSDTSSWEDVEIPLGSVRSAAELLDTLQKLPGDRLASETRVPFRAAALQAGREIQDTEALFRAGPYRAHVEAIDGAARELTALVGPRDAELARALKEEMGASAGLPPIVLTLVAEAPYAAAFAADDLGHTAAVFVRVRGLSGTALLETALAEAIHAVDELSVRDEGTSMNVLRAALARRGLDAGDSDVGMVVNTLMFAEAASLVRRFVDANHRPLGESGFYEIYPPARAIVGAWERHLAGATLDVTAEAIARVVSGP
jgi:hypothetical protein